MRNFMKKFQNGPPSEEKEIEATTDTELSSTEDIHPLAVQEPPQNSNIRQLIKEECYVEVLEQQKQKMEDTMFELVKICQEKEFLCIHDDVDDLIESALNSKLLLINSKSQQSNAENLLPIPSKCEVTLEDEIECDMPAKDDCSPVFTTFSNPFFKDNDDLDSSDDESHKDVPTEEFKIYSNPLCNEDEINKLDLHCFNVESDFVESLLNRDTFIDFSSKFDFSGELAHIKPEIPKSDFDFEEEICLIENLLYDNSFPRLPEELNAEIADTIVESIPLLPIPVQDGNSQQEEIDIVTETDDVLPPSDDNDDDYDPLLGEADLFLSDNSIPPGIENVADDLEGDVRFLEELLINDSIFSHESYDSNFEDNPSIPRPPLEPPNVDSVFDLKPDEKEPEATTDTELSSTEDIHPLAVQEPPQNSNICQLIREECYVEVPEQQKHKMEDTMFELVKICQEKEFLCIHDNVDDLIESALNSKLLLINLKSQRLDKKEQEVKNVVEQLAESGNRNIQSLQKFRVVHKKSNAENLLPIPSKCEVTLEDEIECDMPAKDDCSPVFTNFSNPLFKDIDDLDSSDDESLPDEDVPAEEFKIYSNPLCNEDEINKLDPHCFNVESDFVESLLRDTFIDFSFKFDFSGELAHIKPEIPKSNFDFKEEIRLIENFLYDNSFPRPPEELNAEIADTIIESIPLLPIPVQDGEADLFLSDNSIPPGIENIADDLEGDVRFLEELLINDSILSYKSYDSNFEDNPSILRPPPEPPDVESFFDLKPNVIAEEISDKLNEDKCFDPGREINVSTKIKDDDYFLFMFVI
nr:hypothetical protein [Tanacetum cinerariifolium]